MCQFILTRLAYIRTLYTVTSRQGHRAAGTLFTIQDYKLVQSLWKFCITRKFECVHTLLSRNSGLGRYPREILLQVHQHAHSRNTYTEALFMMAIKQNMQMVIHNRVNKWWQSHTIQLCAAVKMNTLEWHPSP